MRLRALTIVPLCLAICAGVGVGVGVADAQPPAAARAADSGAASGAVEPLAADSLVLLDAISLDDVAVEGSTVFTPRELDALTAAYEGVPVSFESLQQLRHELSQRYVERGYVTSGVVIPDQRVTGGGVVLRAVEGTLSDITVEGNRRLRSGPIERRIRHYLDAPLNVADLQAGLSFLQHDPLVERVNAELVPGETLGESRLRIGVTEHRPLEIGVTASNDRSPAVGEDRATFALNYRGLVGNGDMLSGRFGVTEGANDNAIFYEVPLAPGGTKLAIALAEEDADIIEEPFDTIDIASRIETWSLVASRKFVDDGARSLGASIGFEHKRSESTLLGMPFSFSPGDVDGEAKGSAVLLGAEWSKNLGSRTLVARGTLAVGVDALDATRNEQGPDGDFVTFLGQLQYATPIAWRDSRVLVRGLIQIADDSLLAMYKLPVGGRYTVRGYRESRLVRDNGFVASAEYRFPAFVDATGQRRGKLDIAAFVDYGLSVDEEAALFSSEREHLSSVGIGLLWNPLPGLSLDIYRGEPLEDEEDGPDETLQDRGIHYQLSFRRAF